ncbi:kinase-like protein [Hymenopellis radicata]|nr:kinase-like protein [Hymenopellis radicata]
MDHPSPSLPQIDNLDVRRYIEFIRTACELERFPFGLAWFTRIAKDFDLLFDWAGAPGAVLPPRYVQKCYFTFKLIEAWSGWPPLEWIRNHEHIHNQLIQRVKSRRAVQTEVPLSHRRRTSNRTTQGMTDEEWSAEVFQFINNYTWANRDHLRKPENLEDAQICLDAVHRLVESNKPTPRRQLKYLIKICQDFMLLPRRLQEIPSESPDQSSQGGNHNSIGTSSVVRKAITNSGKAVALKEIRLCEETLTMRKNKRQFIKESLILHHLSHPNILAFFGIIDEPYRLCIMSDWQENGDMRNYISNHPEASIKELLEGVADGLDFMHSNTIVHGDLKGPNVLVDADGRPRIADFGLSFVYDHPRAAARDTAAAQKPLTRASLIGAGLSESQASSVASTILSSDASRAGTIHWMSPERLCPALYAKHWPAGAKPTPQSDVFSFAMVAVEAYTGQNPFGSGVNEGLYIVNIVLHKERPPRPLNMPLEIWRIVVDCWRDSPQERPSIKDVYFRISILSS